MEYRYHKMARNDGGWLGPVVGRLNRSTDYVGVTGFGHEDWNFSGSLWSDGKIHLYLRREPARVDQDKLFNIVLGQHAGGPHYAVGLCRSASYTGRGFTLPEQTRLSRADQLHELDQRNQLSGELKGLSVEEKAKRMFDGGEVYWVTVDPENLIKFDEPVPIPEHIVKPNYNRYGLVRLTQEAFDHIELLASRSDSTLAHEVELFPEGSLVARAHLVRERNPVVVAKAKVQFRARHGSLHCEACKWPEGSPFEGLSAIREIIEAHHDIRLSSVDHTGMTKAEDLRMLCPSCHRAIHRLRPELRVNEFRKMYFPE